MIVAFFLVNRSDNTTTDYLIVGNNLIWHENDGKWYQLNDYTDEVGSNNYWVYDGTNVSKASSAQYTNYKWYFFDVNETYHIIISPNNYLPLNTCISSHSIFDTFPITPTNVLVNKFFYKNKFIVNQKNLLIIIKLIAIILIGEIINGKWKRKKS